MSDKLRFDASKFEVKTYEVDGRRITCRAFEGVEYCENPADGIQKMNIYVPEQYYHEDGKNPEQNPAGYDLQSAPIFMPNTVGGYMQGPAMTPGIDHMNGGANSAFEALCHGYVVACAGIRGRNTGMNSSEVFVGGSIEDVQSAGGKLVGRAPALIVDMKAAIRYLRHNAGLVPGNVERIVTNGTSAGGALSAMTGATGNSADYAPYLQEIGAADERDDIFAASCYCPIHNLENADTAYEWLFNKETTWTRMHMRRAENGSMERFEETGALPASQIALSKELKDAFPAYVNSLGLKDENENALTLDAEGNGSFKEYVKAFVIAAAQKELDTHWSINSCPKMVPGSSVEEQAYLTIEDGKVTDLDWDGYVHAITRMKTVPAFDDLALMSPECEEFGDDEVYARHFTAAAQKHSAVPSEIADDAKIKLLNPVRYIGSADSAPHWRIRHGAYDRDTAIAIPTILATLLKNNGYDVDFALPWGLPHSGDYDLDQLFAWIDGLCK